MIWTTEQAPGSNTDDFDGSRRQTRQPVAGGTLFRVGQIEPGQRTPMHRTISTDYGLVLEGELDMELDGGEVVHLKQGDVVVQRGTNHSWINRGSVPCKMAWILIDAEPVRIGDRVLEAVRPGQAPPNGH
jgi:quercetin dioxygenase-like cupin family protein